jgi:hypothetical protein
MKIRLTESQLERLKANLNEASLDEQYNREITAKFYQGTYKGYEINDIAPIKLRVSFTIDIEMKSWGIRDINLGGITGPSEVEVEVNYYVDNDNTEDAYVTIPLDWSKLITEKDSGNGIITVGDEVEIYLMQNEEGNLVVERMEMVVYSI